MTAPSSLTVAPFAGTAAEWDGVVSRSAGGTHFHRWGWKQVMERALGHECTFLAATQSGTLRGVLPLTSVKSLLFGRYLVSMPFVNYGGPLGDSAAVQALTREAVAQADRDRVKLLELRSRVELPLDLPVSHRKITVVLDLPSGDAKPLWEGLPAKVRSQVRRPQKEGVTVSFGPDQLDGFYRVFAHHMRDLGTPVQSRRLFEEILKTFPDDVWFGCAWLRGQPIAGGCGFRWGDEFEITWASALRAHQAIAPNMALYWGFLERSVAEGVTLFNFGRCSPDSGTHRFKLQWGSRDEPLWWYAHGRGAATTPSPDDGAYSWGPRLWKRLPLAVANLVGPRIVRLIP
ncbi:MAG TPA: FemAB family XrtA/PEP-CTERM system-associated protein [Gemmatimonadales bacterium]|nr:FemAB family XrtA/PEP-CTERM system-associated protein [Gemmatimonadales bacterium]